jgi:pyruvate ferredoxin oxidoreductase alpha subunit
VAICQDGFITSHGVERVEIYGDRDVRAFVGEYSPQWPLLDTERPKTYGSVAFHDYYYEHKRQQVEAMEQAKRVVRGVAREFNEQFERDYGFFESYRLEDAKAAVVVVNSTAGTAKTVVDRLRDEGLRVGLLKLRVFRPFPGQELAQALRRLKALAVLDRSISFGAMDNAGPLFLEFVTALSLHDVRLPVIDCVYGIGGRDIQPLEIEAIYRELLEIARTGETGEKVRFLGVRE